MSCCVLGGKGWWGRRLRRACGATDQPVGRMGGRAVSRSAAGRRPSAAETTATDARAETASVLASPACGGWLLTRVRRRRAARPFQVPRMAASTLIMMGGSLFVDKMSRQNDDCPRCVVADEPDSGHFSKKLPLLPRPEKGACVRVCFGCCFDLAPADRSTYVNVALLQMKRRRLRGRRTSSTVWRERVAVDD